MLEDWGSRVRLGPRTMCPLLIMSPYWVPQVKEQNIRSFDWVIVAEADRPACVESDWTYEILVGISMFNVLD